MLHDVELGERAPLLPPNRPQNNLSLLPPIGFFVTRAAMSLSLFGAGYFAYQRGLSGRAAVWWPIGNISLVATYAITQLRQLDMQRGHDILASMAFAGSVAAVSGLVFDSFPDTLQSAAFVTGMGAFLGNAYIVLRG